MEHIKYIENNQSLGIDYDIKEIRKLYKSLNCPKEVYNPDYLPLEKNHYYVLLSERQLGKTTNLLLYGMCFNWKYGTIIHYVRQTADMIAPKSIQDIFSTIIKYDYISRLTEGKYNTVVYLHRRWYLAKQVEGEIVDRCENHFMFDCSVDKAFDLKSSYNCPVADFIIFDEFIGKYYTPNEFIRFCDLLKTLVNNRVSPYVFLIANTIDRHSPYFSEMEIEREILSLPQGVLTEFTSSRGTKICVEIIQSTKKTKSIKTRVNELFFNFKNPNLSAITGGDVWSVDNYPHLPEDNPEKISETGLYISISGLLLKIDLVYSETLDRSLLYIHRATRTHSDSTILVTRDIQSPNESYLLSNKKIKKFIKRYYDTDSIVFNNNTDGSTFSSFIRRCRSDETSL